MWYPNLQGVTGWFFQHDALTLGTIATVAAAMLIGCALGCVCTPCKEKDEIFPPHGVSNRPS